MNNDSDVNQCKAPESSMLAEFPVPIKEFSEMQLTCNHEINNCNENCKQDDQWDQMTFDETVKDTADIQVLKKNSETQTSMDIPLKNDIWTLPESDQHQNLDDTEELSSYFGQTKTIKHEIKCCCHSCTIQRAFVKDKIRKTWNWQSQGLKVREYIRCVFNAAIDGPCVPNIPKFEYDPIQYSELQKIVEELVINHPHKFFLMLIIQAQEFVVELKIRIMQPFANTNDIDKIAEVFLTRLLNGYDVLINTAVQITDLIKSLEEKHLNKFNLTWEFFNKKLYQNYIYFYEPIIRNILPFIVRQLRKSCTNSNNEYKLLLEWYLHFVDEIMKTADLWTEKELLIDKYNSEQISNIVNKRKSADDWTIWTIEEALAVENERNVDVPGLGLNQTPFDCYFIKLLNELETTVSDKTEFLRRILDTWSRQAYQTLAVNYLGIHWYESKEKARNEASDGQDPGYYFGYQSGACLVLNCPADGNVEIETNCSVCGELTWVSHLVVNGRTKSGSCAHPGLPDEQETSECNNLSSTPEKPYKRCICTYRHLGEWQGSTFRGLLLFPPCLCMLNIRQFAVSAAGNADSTCLCVKNDISLIRKSSDQLRHQKLAQETPEVKKTVKVASTYTQTRHSAVQTSSSHSCNHDGHQRCVSNGLIDAKTTGSFSKIRNLKKNNNSDNKTNNNNNVNNSTSHNCLSKRANIEHIKRVSNSVDNSDSASIEDSCSSADSPSPRDSGKHCDCCYCEVFGHGIPSVASVSRNYNETRERLRQLLTKKKAKCGTMCNSPPPESITVSNTNSTSDNSSLGSKPSTPVPNPGQSQKRDNRDLNVLLDFIEGNQQMIKKDVNIKKSEKRARQKQKKLETDLKLQQVELDRKKLVELQKKTPGVTITVVDPQKPISQKLFLNRNLPEVSILPATLSLQQKHMNERVCSNINNMHNVHNVNIINNNNNVNKSNKKNKDDKKNRVIGINEILSSSQPKSGKVERSHDVKDIMNPKGKKAEESILVPTEPQPEQPLTKKQRKKLKREMAKKMEDANSEPKKVEESQPQIVTIKRVMESNSAEPTVTITLKGQTPAEDKVLFTLINGQTKEPIKEANPTQSTSGKKKKKKKKGQDNQSNQINQSGQQQKPNQSVNQQVKSNQSVNQQSKPNQSVKQQNQQNVGKTKSQLKADKILKEQPNEWNKVGQKNAQISLPVTKNVTINNLNNNADNKTKKNKKNVENKQPSPSQQKNNAKGKNQQAERVEPEKRPTKSSTGQPLAEIKIQSNVTNLTNTVSNKKKNKALKKQNSGNSNNNNENNKNQYEKLNKQQTFKLDNSINPMKTTIVQQPMSKLLRNNIQQYKISNYSEQSNSLSSQLKDGNSKINIENLKLPPGITITKVDAPVKPLPIKSTPLLKQQATSASKQATIIAAPMSNNGMQSNYSSSQSPGNVIVVDTGKLKQDLLPNNEKGGLKDYCNGTSSSKKKKKKKKNNNNATNSSNPGKPGGSMSKKLNDVSSKYSCDEQARIVHNPGSNMVTIRNPAFGTVPKMEPLQQAAIIKLSENGMVTIRSPALQQAINAGLTPPPKPDFIVKGDFVTGNNAANNKTPAQSNHMSGQKCTSGFISSNISDLRNKLSSDCGNLSGFGNIQISKVTNGQPIPENGINIKGTSVTLTKINSPETVPTTAKVNDNQQSTGSKTKKKKKKTSGTKSCGDDWHLVESVFTPKDIDLEDGEMDDAERELEAFKRFCLQSVPPPRKEKVNLNIKDIILKKKSSSAAAAAAAIIAAN